MFTLLHYAFRRPLSVPVYYQEALSRTVTAAVGSLVEARRARWQIGRHLETLVQAGQQDTPHCRQMQAAHQQLSAQIDQLQQFFKGKQEQMGADLGPSHAFSNFHNFAGIEPLGASTLGPTDSPRHGLVSVGSEVVKLQKFLKAAGYPVTASGEFDVPTRLAVRKFQEQHELPSPTETIVGIDTRQLINDLIEGK